MIRAAVLALVGAACHRGGDARVLDAFDDVAAWRATGSDGVTAQVQSVPGAHGRALRLSVDLGGTAGYGVARRALPLELPANFALSFALRGEIPANNFELKLIDDTGDNVWWFHRPSFAFPASWRSMTVARRQIEFAWGPIADHTLRRTAAIELVVSAGSGGGKGWIEIDDLALRPLPATGASGPAAGDPPEWTDAAATAWITGLGARLPRGSLPRGFSGEQVYWTLVGVDGGSRNSLLSEDGALEVGGGASLEPFLEIAGRPIGWASAGAIEHTLADGYLPIPSVTWRGPRWELQITALAAGDTRAAELAARYTVRNPTGAPITARLVLAVRPLQVNPPTQILNLAGGVHRIERIAWSGSEIALDGAPAVRPLTPPAAVALWPHPLGYPIAPIPGGAGAPPGTRMVDPAGLASGALVYDLALPPHGETSVVVTAPLIGAPVAPAPRPPAAATEIAWFDATLATVRAAWHDKLDRVGFRVPAAGRPIIDTLRSSLAYLLLSRDGAILRPGTRSYARAWIRDGALIGEALLRLGHPDVAADFLRWYAPYQFASGKVPCCVEARGAVPVPENDSHGELIYLAAEVQRYTRDRALAAALWPHVLAAARYLEELRQSERRPENQTAERRALWGLLPPTISHEGYSAKPAYSYWDDFWAVAGFRDAAWLAGELGETAAAAQLAAQGDAFTRDLVASIRTSAAAHHVDYIPGAADLGDFDATSTTIALSPGGFGATSPTADPPGPLSPTALPADLVRATFERAWQTLVERGAGHDPPGGAPHDAAYTPYELRLIGAFVRLGWRDRARAALAMYLADRRPAGWNQWAEVVGVDPRAPRFVGDMPHAWVHSDYARSVLDLFVHERAGDHAWVLAAGIPPDWFTGDGFAIDRLPTPFGPLSYAVTRTGDTVTLEIAPGAVPPGGLVFPWPWPSSRPELVIDHRPATIVLSRGDPQRP